MAARVEGWKAGDGEFCWPRETKISRYYMKERQRASRSLWKAEVKAAEKWGLETSWHRVLENEILANWSETRHQLHPLVFPGTWTAAKVKLRQAATLSKLRSKCIMFGSPGVWIENMNYCFVIDEKQNAPARPTRAPNIGGRNNREEFLVSNWQRELKRRPSAMKPFVVHKCSITDHTRCIWTNSEIKEWLKGWKKKERYPIPLAKTFHPLS